MENNTKSGIIALIVVAAVISAYLFLSLQISNETPPATGTPPGMEIKPVQLKLQSESLWVSGVITGENGHISPVFKIPGTATIGENNGAGPYSIELLSADGTVLKTYYFMPTQVMTQTFMPESETTYVFSFTIPVTQGIKKIQLKHGSRILDTADSGMNSPEIKKVLSSEDFVNKNIGSELNLTWVAEDKDGDEITYAVYYSADRGKSWTMLGTTLNPTLNLQTAMFGKTSSGYFMILASDGVNTGAAVIGPFSIESKKPLISIYYLVQEGDETLKHPEEGTVTVKRGRVLSFGGGGLDPEDGSIADDKLVWTSDKDGILGKGQLIQLENGLSLGTHTITLTGTDRDGNTVSRSVTVIVK